MAEVEVPLKKRLGDLWGVSWVNLIGKVCSFAETECINVIGLRQGSTHKVCEFQMEDGQVFVVRFLSPVYETWTASKRTMASEIATMRYVREHTSIPVPEVFYHDKDEDKSVGYEWMLMEKVPGINLAQAWRHLDDVTQERVVASISDVWVQLFNTRFNKIGSIYSVDGNEEFYVGPLTFRPFPGGQPPKEELCGPFNTSREWLTAIAEGRMQFNPYTSLNSKEEARIKTVLSTVRESSIPYLDARPSGSLDVVLTSANVLHHPDLNNYNIMIDETDPGTITGVIDWEGSSVLPLWSIQTHFHVLAHFQNEASKEALHQRHVITLKRMNSFINKSMPGWSELVKGCREARVLLTRATFSASDTEIVEDALRSDSKLDELC